MTAARAILMEHRDEILWWLICSQLHDIGKLSDEFLDYRQNWHRIEKGDSSADPHDHEWFRGTVAPSIFSFSGDGRGMGAFTHADSTPVSPENPALPGEIVVMYTTGLGRVSPGVPTGMLPTGESRTTAAATVSVDGVAVAPEFAGLAGCCVGLNQVNFRVPRRTRSGNSIPVFLTIRGRLCNTVMIAVQ